MRKNNESRFTNRNGIQGGQNQLSMAVICVWVRDICKTKRKIPNKLAILKASNFKKILKGICFNDIVF